MAAAGCRREARLAALYYQGDYIAVRRETSSHMSDRGIRETEREKESNERHTTTRKPVTIQRELASCIQRVAVSNPGAGTQGRVFCRAKTAECGYHARGIVVLRLSNTPETRHNAQ